MLDEYELVLVLIGFLMAFLLAFGIGANDVANTFGTSVGAKVLTLRAACTLASICELAGSILLGGHVSKTIKAGIVDISRFNNSVDGATLLMQGQVSSLAGACIWMLIATFFRLPVSGTHSIVGATAGFGLVQFGLQGIKWMGLLKIVLSWFISPILSGAVSFFIFFFIKQFVLSKERPLEPALRSLPFIFACTIIVNVFSVLFGGIPRYVELLKQRELDGWNGTSDFDQPSRFQSFFKNAYNGFLDFVHCRVCHKGQTLDTESGLHGSTSGECFICWIRYFG
ncbi:unnamed protein product [Dibothriocephalus latus]|uniref:Phosphate transporter n=1 Tax=Dibothriocephalus latus TaxID=60516 RepID=A0A3P7PD79_DIBLA|nr:unnamed protein product [Dibothriocephalus latus]